MRKPTKVAVICVAVVAAAYGLFSALFQNIPVRFRITVEIIDGDQTRIGSSVIEVSYPIYPDNLLPGQHASERRITGYAATVDLGEKGLLFVTFSNALRTSEQQRKRFQCPLSDIACLPFAAYATPSRGFSILFRDQKAALDELLRQSGPREVSFVDLPELIRSFDMHEKRMERILSPFDLSPNFGPGVRLSRVTLELSDSAITPQPQIWPQWLKTKGQNPTFKGYEND